MKLLLALTVIVAVTGAVAWNLATSAAADVVDLGPGKIRLLEGFIQKREQGIDSTVGAITSGDGKLVIRYDIGAMAGRYMHAGRKGQCVWYREQVIGGRRFCSGLVQNDSGPNLYVTIVPADGDDATRGGLPANFMARVGGEKDVADVLLTVLTWEGSEPVAGKSAAPATTRP